MYGDISELVGKTLTQVEGGVGSGELVFVTDEGGRYCMWHEQDCCESVEVEDICGEIADLIGEPILVAEQSTSDELPAGMPETRYRGESETWTFYRLATKRGYVVIRWYGSSNGHYGESVTFRKAS